MQEELQLVCDFCPFPSCVLCGAAQHNLYLRRVFLEVQFAAWESFVLLLMLSMLERSMKHWLAA